AFLMTLKDQYFHLGDTFVFIKVFSANALFVFLGILIMIISTMYFLENRFIRKLEFIRDDASGIIALIVSCILMYAIKYFIVKYFDLQFKFPYIIIFLDLILMMIFPVTAYLMLKQFKHGH
ncbi:MAG: hypothetical protein OEZ34_16685, partial [Spirochaetia bacterium]|nr:hypothetical protein [Spirochaetia bacterium]